MAKARIAHITMVPYENDARVLRSVNALKSADFDCPVIAPGHGFQLPQPSFAEKALIAARFSLGGRMTKQQARKQFFSFAHHSDAVDCLVKSVPQAIHAHDWDGLLVAAKAGEIMDVPFVYDAHELAGKMHSDRFLWNASVGTLIRKLEAAEARKAASVIAVSEGHAEMLHDHLGLEKKPSVVRNIADVPSVPKVEPRAKHAPILLHYHGALSEGRGIELTIDALAQLPPIFQLRLTGHWTQATFEKKVRAKIQSLGMEHRVEIHPSVSHQELVVHASEADIGLCILTPDNLHNRIALPNKVFDYLKAGLAIVSGGTQEVEFVVQGGAALSLQSCEPSQLISALQDMDRKKIDQMRGNAIDIARKNDWSRERKVLTDCWSLLKPLLKQH